MSDSEQMTPTTPGPTTEPAAIPPPPANQDPATDLTAEITPPAPQAGPHWGTGRRKSAVARVRMQSGSGRVVINEREVEQYFPHPQDQRDAVAPLEITGVRRHWDVLVNVAGGGTTGQAGAVRLGLSRALVKAYNQFELTLRNAGFLTRDARRVERKKPGQRKARRRFQFSKR